LPPRPALARAARPVACGRYTDYTDYADYTDYTDCAYRTYQVRAIAPERVAAMRAALLRVRPAFLFHLDPSRPSAVDQILLDMCAGAST